MRAELDPRGFEVLHIENREDLEWVYTSLLQTVNPDQALLSHLEITRWFDDEGTPRFPLALCYTDASTALNAIKNRRGDGDEATACLVQ